jgi:hypothetical protein
VIHGSELAGHNVQEQPNQEMETSLVASSQIFPSQMGVQHLAVTASHLELPLFIEGKWS